MKQSNKEAIKLGAIALMLGTVFLFFQTFVTAYQNPSKSVTIYIDNHGEADVEMFIILPCVMLFALFGIIITIIDMTKSTKEEMKGK